MDFFEKHKALIITVLFCSVLILGLYNFNLSQKKKIEQQMLVDLEEYTEAEETEEEKPAEEPKPETTRNSPKRIEHSTKIRKHGKRILTGNSMKFWRKKVLSRNKVQTVRMKLLLPELSLPEKNQKTKKDLMVITLQKIFQPNLGVCEIALFHFRFAVEMPFPFQIPFTPVTFREKL